MFDNNKEQIETNFYKIQDNELTPLDYGTKTIAETSDYTPLGAYTTFRTYDHYGVLGLAKHMDRLEETSRLAGHSIRLNRSELKKALTGILSSDQTMEKRVRITIDLEHEIGTIYIASEPLSVPAPEKYQEGIVCKTAEAHRDNPKAKLSNFLSRAEGIREKEEGVFDEILMYTADGDLLEGLSSNFYGIIGETIYNAEEGVLSGTTRNFILKIASEIGLPVKFEPVSLSAIDELDEAFISSTSRAVLPIRSIDGIEMRKEVPGPLTKQLMEKFDEELASQIEKVYD